MKNKNLPFEKYPTKFCFIFKKENFSTVLELRGVAYYAKTNNGDRSHRFCHYH